MAEEATAEQVVEARPEASSNGNVHEIARLASPMETISPSVPVGTTTQGIIPILIPKKASSGSYAGSAGSFRLELRVDVDGKRPCNLVSGDFFTIAGGVTTYFGSFKSGAVSAVWTDSSVTLTGVLSTTWSTTFNHFRITIPRVMIIVSGNPAAL